MLILRSGVSGNIGIGPGDGSACSDWERGGGCSSDRSITVVCCGGRRRRSHLALSSQIWQCCDIRHWWRGVVDDYVLILCLVISGSIAICPGDGCAGSDRKGCRGRGCKCSITVVGRGGWCGRSDLALSSQICQCCNIWYWCCGIVYDDILILRCSISSNIRVGPRDRCAGSNWERGGRSTSDRSVTVVACRWCGRCGHLALSSQIRQGRYIWYWCGGIVYDDILILRCSISSKIRVGPRDRCAGSNWKRGGGGGNNTAACTIIRRGGQGG